MTVMSQSAFATVYRCHEGTQTRDNPNGECNAPDYRGNGEGTNRTVRYEYYSRGAGRLVSAHTYTGN